MRDVFVSFHLSSRNGRASGFGNVVFQIEDDEKITKEVLSIIEEKAKSKAVKQYGGRKRDYQVLMISVCYL